jgi:hypothetical protein
VSQLNVTGGFSLQAFWELNVTAECHLSASLPVEPLRRMMLADPGAEDERGNGCGVGGMVWV